MRHTSKQRPKAFFSISIVVGIVLALCLMYVLGGNKTADTTSTTQQQVPETTPQLTTDKTLQTALASWVQKQSYRYGIVVEELANTKTPLQLRTAEYRADASMVPASTYKIFVAYAMLHSIEQGSYTLNSQTRNGQTVEQCFNKMLINSDNDCGRALGFLLGWDDINALLNTKGYEHTDLANYPKGSDEPVGDKHTTARDLAAILRDIQTGSLLNETHTELLLNTMKRQIWRERIAAGLPAGTVIASKPGWLPNVQADAGIIYGPSSTYILVILSDGQTPKPLAELSKLVYDHLEAAR